MSDDKEIYPPVLKNPIITPEKYTAMYAESVNGPEKFWASIARRLDWFTAPTKIKNSSFDSPVSIKWYEDGVLNACSNCIDRHLPVKAGDIAIIWEGDEPGTEKKITYAQLKDEVCKLANALKFAASKKETASLSTCRWCRKRPMPCWPAPGSARCIPLFSAASLRLHWWAESMIADQTL